MVINFAALFQRVFDLLTTPRKTWRVIRSEPDRGRRLVTHYVLLLALASSACSFLGVLLFEGRYTFGDRFLFSLLGTLFKLAIFVGSIPIMGRVITSLAPSFDSAASKDSALKLMAYASTPVWVAGLLTFVPKLTALAALAGFGYAGYLFSLGAPAILGTPPRRSVAFSLAVVITWFAITLISAWIVIQIIGLMFTPALLLGGLGQAPATN